MLDVPDQQQVEEGVEDEHERHHEEREVVVGDGRLGDVGPLHADAHLLVEGEVLGAEPEGGGGEERGQGLGVGGDLVARDLLLDGDVHVRHVRQEVDDARAGGRDLRLRVQHADQKTEEK